MGAGHHLSRETTGARPSALKNLAAVEWFHREIVKGGAVDRPNEKIQRLELAASGRVCSAVIKRVTTGQIMSQEILENRKQARRANALVFAAALILAPSLMATAASAQVMSYASPSPDAFPADDVVANPQVDENDATVVPERFRRTIVAYDSREAPGTVVIDTANTQLYYILGQGRAVRYGVGVGREGFAWAGTQTVSRKAEWPDWRPPAAMIARQPYLPRFMAGGPGNPLGARAMYLGASDYRIHGTNDPSTIGKFVSSGCIRLTNEDVEDLFARVNVGAKVVVLPKTGSPRFEASVAPRIATSMRTHPASATGNARAMNVSSLY
jgi:lipoprotein-anchoring transpeptidase ErfK/SrfK